MVCHLHVPLVELIWLSGVFVPFESLSLQRNESHLELLHRLTRSQLEMH